MFSGSTDCQPLVDGSPVGNILAEQFELTPFRPVSASCRDQAGSLRSPETTRALIKLKLQTYFACPVFDITNSFRPQ
jgi:hypothetical protein